MASRNVAVKEVVSGRRKSSEMMSPLPPEGVMVDPEEQQPSCSKAPKRKKKQKRLQDEDEHEVVAPDPDPKAIRGKSRSHDSKPELKKKDADQKQQPEGADKKAESFMEQAGTSTAVGLRVHKHSISIA